MKRPGTPITRRTFALLLLAGLIVFATARADARHASNGKIAFTSDRTGNHDIFVMNEDGTNQIQLTNSPFQDDVPAWSPDGRKIAFQSVRDGNAEIYVMNEDGSNQTSGNGVGDIVFNFGQNGDIPVAGDWDGQP